MDRNLSLFNIFKQKKWRHAKIVGQSHNQQNISLEKNYPKPPNILPSITTINYIIPIIKQAKTNRKINKRLNQIVDEPEVENMLLNKKNISKNESFSSMINKIRQSTSNQTSHRLLQKIKYSQRLKQNNSQVNLIFSLRPQQTQKQITLIKQFTKRCIRQKNSSQPHLNQSIAKSIKLVQTKSYQSLKKYTLHTNKRQNLDTHKRYNLVTNKKYNLVTNKIYDLDTNQRYNLKKCQFDTQKKYLFDANKYYLFDNNKNTFDSKKYSIDNYNKKHIFDENINRQIFNNYKQNKNKDKQRKDHQVSLHMNKNINNYDWSTQTQERNMCIIRRSIQIPSLHNKVKQATNQDDHFIKFVRKQTQRVDN